jgi:farnesyl-diphosphate farnesyltransferase
MTPKPLHGKDELTISRFRFLPDTLWSAWLSAVSKHQENALLKGVSRSFFLSLRLLPRPMRGAASLAYLLARTSDTLADAPGISDDDRLECLENFKRALAGSLPARWPARIVGAVANPRERELLDRTGTLLSWLDRLPPGEAALVREVLEIITSGQALDIRRFTGAGNHRIIALPDAAALDDYTWRVAGCVGAFWTKLGFLTLESRFSSAPQDGLLEVGVAYGKGLQFVNILRDLPEDLRNGRCYLPVEDPEDRVLLLESHRKWLETAGPMVDEGFRYASSLRSRRLRTASVLPAMIARKTLELMRNTTWESLEHRIKVPRRFVHASLLRAMLGRFC